MAIEVRKAAWVLRNEGPAALLSRVLRRATLPLFELGSVTFFVRDLAQEEPASASVPGFETRMASPSDLENLMHGSDPLQPEAALRERFRQGDLCFAAVDARGLAVHTRWVSLNRAPVSELGLDFVPGPEAAYFYNGYTHPDARRRGIDGLVRCRIFSTLRAQGALRAYSYVRGDNPIGLQAARRWQQEVGTVRYLRVSASRPLVFGVNHGPLAGLLRRAQPREAEEHAARERQWREWFESWLREPLAKRSIGYDAVPIEAMRSTAEHVASLLELDRERDVVLDLGCSSALVTRWVAPRCRRLVGVDYVLGLVADGRADADRERAAGAPCGVAAHLTADGRRLPFPSGAFGKAYCSGVIHTLPSREDGLRMIRELIRVCAPGGRILVAAVPDRAKHRRAVAAAWRRSSPIGKLRLVLSLGLPRAVKRAIKSMARRVTSGPRWETLVYLEYDLAGLAADLERSGLRCRVVDFPDGYWSEDFGETRSNLLIDIPS